MKIIQNTPRFSILKSLEAQINLRVKTAKACQSAFQSESAAIQGPGVPGFIGFIEPNGGKELRVEVFDDRIAFRQVLLGLNSGRNLKS